MALIGEFEAAVREADPNKELDTFILAGPGGADRQTFTISDEPNIVALGMFARAAREGVDSNDMEGLATLIDTIASVVIPEDESRFLNLATRHRLDPELLLKIVSTVMEAQSGLPTEQPADSSVGQLKTGVNWRVHSSFEGASIPNWRDTPFGRRELDPETGHPELYEDIGNVSEIGRALVVG